MKRVLYLLIPIFLIGCMSPIIDEREDILDAPHSVLILTRSASATNYPIALYAFHSQDGTLAASTTLCSEQDDPVLSLPQGHYQLVAVAGKSGCNIPPSPTLSDIIAAPANGLLDSPLEMGSTSIYVLQNTTTSIMLSTQATAIRITLHDIPTNATAVTTSLSPIASGLSFDGNSMGSTTATVSLTQEDTVWRSQQFYTLPSTGDQITLSITTTTPTGVKTYGYTYPASLKAATPYILSGSMSEGPAIDGSLTLEGWNETETISFTFDSQGGGNTDNDSTIINPTDILFEVEEMPTVGTLWNGYFIAGHTDSDDAIERMLLLSATEWTNITGATHETMPHMAAEIANTYTEGELSGWRIPTRSEVRKLCATLGNTSVVSTNAFLTTNGLVPLSYGESVRYLCDEAKFSFRWDSEGKPSAVGTKRTYHLRLVHTVGFIVK